MADIDQHDLPLSPAELVADLIKRYGTTADNYEVKVGPATDAETQAGVVSTMAAGLPLIEKYVPLMWHRTQILCRAGDLATADLIAALVQRDMHGLVRKICYQASNDTWYLIHLSNITAGPSMHYDTPAAWETLLFGELLIASDPLATGPDYPF